jgi:BASS family bile acid:Na+ symporter
MADRKGFFGRTQSFLHHNFLWLLAGSYLLAAVCPWPGAVIRQTAIVNEGCFGAITLPMLLLAFLLFNAGLASDATDLAGLVRRPLDLIAGVAATIAVPLAVVACLAEALGWWPDPDEARCLVAGLGVVAAMPVAGSSAAWSQQAGGSTALSIGLVVVSTLLSPLTTPLALAAIGPLAGSTGSPSTPIGPGTVSFLLVAVVIPSAIGMAARLWMGRTVATKVQPPLKATGTLALLVLCYANATASLPSVIANPDWDYIALVMVAACMLCSSGFAAGWVVSRLVGAGDSQRRSLVFGLGMTNNGTGLVLAGAALSGMPAAILPILSYNLIQHLFAGAVSRRLVPADREREQLNCEHEAQ